MNLFGDDATGLFDQWLGVLPDPDEVLRKAGKSRSDLEILLTDGHIFDSYRKRLLALKATQWQLNPARGRDIPFLRDQLTRHLPAVWSMTIRALCFGYAVAERVYEPGADGRRVEGLARITEKPLEWFVPQRDGRLTYFPNGRGGLGQDVDLDHKFLLIRNDPSWKNPYGESYLSKLFWPWYFKTGAAKGWAQTLDRYATPLIHAEMNGQQGDRAKRARELYQAMRRGVMVTGAGEKVTTIQSKLSDPAVFERFLNFWIRSIRILFTGHNLGSEVDKTGAFAAVQGANDNLSMFHAADCQVASGAIQNVIQALMDLRGGTRVPLLEFTNEDRGRHAQDARLERDQKLYGLGVRFTRDHFEREYGLNTTAFNVIDASDLISPTSGKLSANHGHDCQKLVAFEMDELERLAGKAINTTSQPLKVWDLRVVINRAEDEHDLRHRLQDLVDVDPEKDGWSDGMAQTLFLAAALGYKDAINDTTRPLALSWRRWRVGRLADPIKPMRFDEAIEAMRARGVVLPDVYYGVLQDAARAKAFSVAGLARTNQIQGILDQLTAAIEEGLSLESWRKTLTDLDLGLPHYRLENIYRTNIMVDHAKGRYIHQEENKDIRPYGMIKVIEDGRTRDNHLAMKNFVAHLDDPIWQSIAPPNGFQCRCKRITVTLKQPERIGFSDNRNLVADDGWGYFPEV